VSSGTRAGNGGTPRAGARRMSMSVEARSPGPSKGATAAPAGGGRGSPWLGNYSHQSGERMSRPEKENAGQAPRKSITGGSAAACHSQRSGVKRARWYPQPRGAIRERGASLTVQTSPRRAVLGHSS